MIDVTMPSVGTPNWGPAVNHAVETIEGAINGMVPIVVLTAFDYDAMPTPRPMALYFKI